MLIEQVITYDSIDLYYLSFYPLLLSVHHSFLNNKYLLYFMSTDKVSFVYYHKYTLSTFHYMAGCELLVPMLHNLVHVSHH